MCNSKITLRYLTFFLFFLNVLDAIDNKTKNSSEFFKNINPEKYDPKPLYKEFDMLKFLNSIKILFKELDRIDPEGFHSSRINSNMKKL